MFRIVTCEPDRLDLGLIGAFRSLRQYLIQLHFSPVKSPGKNFHAADHLVDRLSYPGQLFVSFTCTHGFNGFFFGFLFRFFFRFPEFLFEHRGQYTRLLFIFRFGEFLFEHRGQYTRFFFLRLIRLRGLISFVSFWLHLFGLHLFRFAAFLAFGFFPKSFLAGFFGFFSRLFGRGNYFPVMPGAQFLDQGDKFLIAVRKPLYRYLHPVFFRQVVVRPHNVGFPPEALHRTIEQRDTASSVYADSYLLMEKNDLVLELLERYAYPALTHQLLLSQKL